MSYLRFLTESVGTVLRRMALCMLLGLPHLQSPQVQQVPRRGSGLLGTRYAKQWNLATTLGINRTSRQTIPVCVQLQ